jgi:excisionase family DNA binding protein
VKGFSHVPPVLDLPGVADLLGISVEEARRLAGEGWIPSATVGERRLFRRDEVLDWFRAQQVKPPDQEGGEVVG